MRLDSHGVVALENIQHYHAFIFDMDGTLLDTMPTHLQAWHETARVYGFPFDIDWVHSLGGMPSRKILEQINLRYDLSIDCDEASEYKMDCFRKLSDNIQPIQITLDILNQFYRTKRIAIGTGSQSHSAERLIHASGLEGKIEVIVGADHVENHKLILIPFCSPLKNWALMRKTVWYLKIPK